MGRDVADRGPGVAGRSGGVGSGVGRSGVDDGAVGAVASGGGGDRPVGVDRWSADDRDGDVCQVDGLKQRYRWGYRSLVAEVSDSIHLRRFCRIALSERVPDESTVRKLTRRIGPETVNEMTRALIVEATRSKRFRARAVRIDSTVIEADVRYPTDADLAAHGVRALAREGRKLAKLVGEQTRRVRDRSRSMGRTLRAVTRTIRRRSGEAKAEVLRLTEQTGKLLEQSITETRRLAAIARRGPVAVARGRSSRRQRSSRSSRIAARRSPSRSSQRVAGEPITDRLVSLGRSGRQADPQGQARQAERVRVRQPALRGHGEHRRGARGLIVPASTSSGTRARTRSCPTPSRN